MSTHDIGIAMLELDTKLDHVEVFTYRLNLESSSEFEATQLTRRGAGQLCWMPNRPIGRRAA